MSNRQSCLWCGKPEGETERLFRGPVVCICSSCVEKMSGSIKDDNVSVAEQVRREVDKAVQESFGKMVNQINLGPMQDKYQRLVRVKFKEQAGSPTFQEVFSEFKKGVDAEIATDDFQTRYDLAIAYYEMGLTEDAFHEMLQALHGALRQKDFDRAGDVISALLFFHGDNARVIKGLFRMMCEAGVD